MAQGIRERGPQRREGGRLEQRGRGSARRRGPSGERRTGEQGAPKRGGHKRGVGRRQRLRHKMGEVGLSEGGDLKEGVSGRTGGHKTSDR